MSFKNAFTKLGLLEDDVPVAKRPATKAAPVVPQVMETQTYTPSFTPTPAVDPAINDMLMQSLQENRLAGFDYLKFISSVEDMKADGGAEPSRFKMAYSVAKQLGVDKASLLKSAEHYLNVLSQDEADFKADCAQRNKSEVKARATKIAQIEDAMTNLTKQLAQLQQDHETLTKELESETTRLETSQSAFQTTLASISVAINVNIQKINQYLN